MNKENQVMLEPMATQEVTAMLVLLESPVQMVLRVYQVYPDLMEPRYLTSSVSSHFNIDYT